MPHKDQLVRMSVLFLKGLANVIIARIPNQRSGVRVNTFRKASTSIHYIKTQKIVLTCGIYYFSQREGLVVTISYRSSVVTRLVNGFN